MAERVSESPLSPEVIEKIDAICDEFESAIRQGTSPQIESVVADSPAQERSALLRELLLLELDYRVRNESSLKTDEYYSRFPNDRELLDAIFRAGESTNRVDDTVDWSLASTAASPTGEPIDAADRCGKSFGRFVLVKLLGRGGFGSVYLAHDPQLHRDVALKFPRAGVLVDPRDVERFLREARAVAQLRHPHIVPVHDAGKLEGIYYIASEFIAGKTLRDVLKQGGCATHRESAAVIAKLAGALHYAHNKGIVHRDIKPENIIIDESGEPYIMDFGLARRDQVDVLRTQEGTLLGTPAYMSPEQAKGESHLADARSDLWSLGVVLYELLTGHRPFAGRGSEVLVKILEVEPEPPRKLDSSVSKDLETICLKCLAKDVNQRYASCQHLADELGRWTRYEPIEARPVPVYERLAQWVRRNPAIAATLAVSVVIVLTVATVAFNRVISERDYAMAQKKLADEKSGIARQKTTEAIRERDNANELLYLTHMRMAAAAWEKMDAQHANELLERHRPKPDGKDYRGWEWFYLKAVMDEKKVQLMIPKTRRQGISSNRVRMAAWKPDGSRMAISTSDGTVGVYDTDSGERLRELWNHTDQISAVAWSASGQFLAAGTQDGQIRAWDAGSWELMGTYKHATETERYPFVATVAWAPDGHRLASAGGEQVIICDFLDENRQTVLTGQTSQVRWLAWRKDGKQLVSVSGEKQIVAWSTETEEAVHIDTGPGRVYHLAISADGRQLAMPGADNSVNLWTISDSKPAVISKARSWRPSSLAFSPDGKKLATAANNQLTVHDIATGESDYSVSLRRGTQVGVIESISRIAWSHDGLRLAALVKRSSQGHGEESYQIIKVLHATGGGEIVSVRNAHYSPKGLLWGPANRRLALVHEYGTTIWNIEDRERVTRSLGADVRAYRWCASKNLFATADPYGNLKVFDPSDTSPIRRLSCGGALRVLDWGPNDVQLAIGSEQSGVYLWDTRKDHARQLSRRKAPVRAVRFSSDGRWLASGGDDGEIRVWNMEEGDPALTIPRANARYMRFRWSPDSRHLALTGELGELRVCAIPEGKEKLRVPMDESFEGQIAWIKNPLRLIAGEMEKLKFFELSGDGFINSKSNDVPALGPLVPSPDGARIATGEIHRVKIRDVRTWNELAMMRGHYGPVYEVAWSPNGQRLITVALDGQMKLWDTFTGQELMTLVEVTDGSIARPGWSPDGRIITALVAGSVRIWDSTTGHSISTQSH